VILARSPDCIFFTAGDVLSLLNQDDIASQNLSGTVLYCCSYIFILLNKYFSLYLYFVFMQSKASTRMPVKR